HVEQSRSCTQFIHYRLPKGTCAVGAHLKIKLRTRTLVRRMGYLPAHRHNFVESILQHIHDFRRPELAAAHVDAMSKVSLGAGPIQSRGHFRSAHGFDETAVLLRVSDMGLGAEDILQRTLCDPYRIVFFGDYASQVIDVHQLTVVEPTVFEHLRYLSCYGATWSFEFAWSQVIGHIHPIVERFVDVVVDGVFHAALPLAG